MQAKACSYQYSLFPPCLCAKKHKILTGIQPGGCSCVYVSDFCWLAVSRHAFDGQSRGAIASSLPPKHMPSVQRVFLIAWCGRALAAAQSLLAAVNVVAMSRITSLHPCLMVISWKTCVMQNLFEALLMPGGLY